MTHPGRVVSHQSASSCVAWIVVVHCLCIASEVVIVKQGEKKKEEVKKKEGRKKGGGVVNGPAMTFVIGLMCV